MADINLSAENVRAALAEANGRLRKAATESFELLEKSLASSPLAVSDQTKQLCDFMQQCQGNGRPRRQTGPSRERAGRAQDPVRIFSRPEAGSDRTGQKYERNRDEGSDRCICPEELSVIRQAGRGARSHL